MKFLAWGFVAIEMGRHIESGEKPTEFDAFRQRKKFLKRVLCDDLVVFLPAQITDLP